MMLYTKTEWEELQKELAEKQKKANKDLDDIITHLNAAEDEKDDMWIQTGVFEKKT